MNHATRRLTRLALPARLAAAAGFLALLSIAPAACARAQILVSDYNLNRVVRLDADGANPVVLVAPASGGLDQPHRARIGPDGLLYVASAGSDQILRYEAATGAFVDAFVGASSGLDYPVDFLFRPDGYVYVTSQQTNSILRYSAANGQRDLGWVASAPDLGAPSGLAFDAAGHLYVSGRFSYNLARFDAATGAHELTFGDVPFALGVAFTPDGRLLAASGYDDSVQVFSAIDAASPMQTTFTSALSFPVGVEIDSSTETLLVANYASGSISRHSLTDGALLETIASGDLLSGPNYFTIIAPATIPEPAVAGFFLGLIALTGAMLRRRWRTA